MKLPKLMVLVLTAFLAACGSDVRAGESAAGENYTTVAQQRAEKIVATLDLKDAAKIARVSAMIAQQYQRLHAIHETRDRTIAEAKQLPDRAIAVQQETTARTNADTAVRSLHSEYIARLAAELTEEQIDRVKDGMTYGVLPLTFRVYQEMLPNLTTEQKAQILAWLTEAREHAMDGGTSDEKHAWFGKYKGKINNYLSAAGIDMKAAEKNLARAKAKS